MANGAKPTSKKKQEHRSDSANAEADVPAERKPQSAAAPSPFPPIADYGFLSNCHTGALVAPDGAVDWLCVPSFDSPSIFGSLLDREAGTFRVGPFGIHVPTARSYEPGTNTLATTWNTPTGWILVRDALTMGPGTARTRSHPTRAHRQTTTATTCWCAPCSASREASKSSSSASRYSTMGGRRRSGLSSKATVTSRTHRGRADDPPANRHGPRHRGRHGPGAAHPDEG